MDIAYTLQFATSPTTPCCLSDIEPQCQLLFRVGIVLLVFVLLACPVIWFLQWMTCLFDFMFDL